MADFCSSPNPGVITHTEQPHTQHEATLKDLPANSVPAGNYLGAPQSMESQHRLQKIQRGKTGQGGLKKFRCTWL